jgi:hypothetical protein
MNPWRLLEEVSDRDLEFIAPGQAEAMRRDPRILEVALDDPRLFARLAEDREAILKVSPFLLFQVLMRQAVRQLRATRFTVERTGFRQRVAVFDAHEVRQFLEEPEVVDYLAELLASFTRVRSGANWYRTKRGWRRRRFSELDLRSLEGLEAEAGPEDRYYLDRRIAEVALFLLGVFPDAMQRPRLHGRTPEEVEVIGATRYERASLHPLAARSGEAALLGSLARRFRVARKALNFLTDQFLYPLRTEWFSGGWA